MSEQYTNYATGLARHLASTEPGFRPHPTEGDKILLEQQGREVSLDLTPFEAMPEPITAAGFFSSVSNVQQLLDAYREARSTVPFETDISGLQANVDKYANEFLETLLSQASSTITELQAQRIANWVSDFDVYVAVKSVESLLNSKADLILLTLADKLGWQVHFDHLAIRCGSAVNHDTERVATLLCERHAYRPCQIEAERMYRFSDGWNAYPLYKILANGQVLRLFLDQSDGSNPKQIIQHWNRVYGYTAHHLAIRATRVEAGRRVAVSLKDMAATLAQNGVPIMTPTGGYTRGLLEQVFAQPERAPDVPVVIKNQLCEIDPQLKSSIENGKLLELLSRREVPVEFARDFYRLYGLEFEPSNPLHSVPVYQYFLPAQAAHVIRTSTQARHRANGS